MASSSSSNSTNEEFPQDARPTSNLRQTIELSGLYNGLVDYKQEFLPLGRPLSNEERPIYFSRAVKTLAQICFNAANEEEFRELAREPFTKDSEEENEGQGLISLVTRLVKFKLLFLQGLLRPLSDKAYLKPFSRLAKLLALVCFYSANEEEFWVLAAKVIPQVVGEICYRGESDSNDSLQLVQGQRAETYGTLTSNIIGSIAENDRSLTRDQEDLAWKMFFQVIKFLREERVLEWGNEISSSRDQPTLPDLQDRVNRAKAQIEAFNRLGRRATDWGEAIQDLQRYISQRAAIHYPMWDSCEKRLSSAGGLGKMMQAKLVLQMLTTMITMTFVM